VNKNPFPYFLGYSLYFDLHQYKYSVTRGNRLMVRPQSLAGLWRSRTCADRHIGGALVPGERTVLMGNHQSGSRWLQPPKPLLFLKKQTAASYPTGMRGGLSLPKDN